MMGDVCPACQGTKTSAGQLSPRGQKIPNTVEAWKHHAYLLADLVEEQREEIRALKHKVNKLDQKHRRKRDEIQLRTIT